MSTKLEMRIEEPEEEKVILNRMIDNLEKKRENGMTIENVQEMAHSIMTMFVPTVTQEYVNKFIEEWRRNNDC